MASKSQRQFSNLDRLVDVDWTFRFANTTEITHNIHKYPARMVPQLPQTFFRHFLEEGIIKDGDMIYDPFGGSGTTALEANRFGLNATLVDLNPLACMIARAKTTPIDFPQLYRAYRGILTGDLPDFRNSLKKQFRFIEGAYNEGSKEQLTRPEVSDQFEWFPKPQLYQLGHLRERIDAVETAYSKDIARFFRVCLSLTSRAISYQRYHEFKRYRIPKEEWNDHDPNVLQQFQEDICNNIGRFTGLEQILSEETTTTVIQGDSRYPAKNGNLLADLVITSPPYGDHRTTVAYGEFSLDQAIISMGISRDRMKDVDRKGLGGTASPLESLDSLRDKSSSLDQVLSELAESSDKRTTDALSFFRDYYECIKSIKYVLKSGQPAVIVVADRQMCRINIPTHQISIDFFEYLDFDLREKFTREIKQKVLPNKNSPENITGKTNRTMNDEYILVFER